jgi:hypothetical protein
MSTIKSHFSSTTTLSLPLQWGRQYENLSDRYFNDDILGDDEREALKLEDNQD